MCGIAGYTSYSGDSTQIRRMCDRIVHRGPDSEGYWTAEDGSVSIGHRRLSIIELSDAGSQPMVSHTGRFVIAFNGEIYNHLEIREYLCDMNAGITFRGMSDTETILEAFEVLGVKETLERMKGMFALVLFDRQDKTLYLMRDRMGEKPLYYGMCGSHFVFGSELSSFKEVDGWTGEIDRRSLALFYRYKSIQAPYTIYRHIYKLMPGMLMKLSAPYTTPSFEYYWSLREVAEKGIENPFTGSFDEAKEELRSRLLGAVKGQLLSDVPLGAFLSGGIDSPLVVSMMQSVSKESVKTFTIGFDDSEHNEATYAADIARHLGTNHTEYYVDEKTLRDVIPILPDIFAEPLADPAAFPNYLVSKIARQHVTVTLSGDGGDELFCGYDMYANVARCWNSRWKRIPRPIAQMGSSIMQAGPWGRSNSLYTLGEYLKPNSIEEFHELFRAEHSYDVMHLVYGAEQCVNDAIDEAMVPWNLISGDAVLNIDTDDMSKMLYKDQIGFMTNTVLNKVDRTGMAVSLENRIPLLDKDVVEFSWSLPIEYKNHAGIGKHILKELLYEYVPKEMLDRPKHGFEVPLKRWLAKGELHEWAGDLISNSHMMHDGLIARDSIEGIWKRFNENGDKVLPLWYVLQMESWYRANKA